MFSQLSRSFLIISAMVLLSACSGSHDALDTLAASAPSPDPAASSVQPAAAPQAAPALVSAEPYAAAPVYIPLVSESERLAEELRLVDFEQVLSIEMNRRAQAQLEREQRIALAARAGIVQGPGCEGTEGNAAVECERSLI
jgi:hypothetical protein